jgi:hypothetical protein
LRNSKTDTLSCFFRIFQVSQAINPKKDKARAIHHEDVNAIPSASKLSTQSNIRIIGKFPVLKGDAVKVWNSVLGTTTYIRLERNIYNSIDAFNSFWRMKASPANIMAAAQPRPQRRISPYRMRMVGFQLRGQTCGPKA